MPMRSWYRIERSGNGKIPFPVEMRANISGLMIEFYRIMDKVNSFKKLREIIESDSKLKAVIFSDAAGQPIVHDASKQMWMLNFLISPFLAEYFSQKGETTFDLKLARTIATNLIQEIQTPVTKYQILTPLINIEIATDVVEISPGVRLVRLKDEQLENWINQNSIISSSPISNMDVLNIKCAIEINSEAHQDKNQARLFSNKLVDLLRLLTNEKIYPAFTEEVSQEGNRPHYKQTSRSWGPSLRLSGTLTTVDASTTNRLVNLWKHLNNSRNAGIVELAFKRWSDTAERLNIEDKLVDYWVGLESLFAADSNQEVKFRASLRIAAFLGETPENRKEIYNDMRNSYDWRSAIVHGEFRKPKKIKELNKKCTIHEITEKTGAYLRTSILQLLEYNDEFDPSGVEMMLLTKHY